MTGMARAAIAAICLLFAQAAAAQSPPDSAARLDRDVRRLESLRQVKDLQRHYAQYAQFGLWNDMARLFARGGRVQWGEERIEGRSAIAQWLIRRGGGVTGLAAGALNTELIDQPLVNLSADGMSAKGRWMRIALLGDGRGGARIEGGIMENAFVLEDGRWKIAALHYFPQYEGDYATGWRNVNGGDLPIVPYHFSPDEAGIPLPEAVGEPGKAASLESLARRIAALNDEDAVRNLQNAYGYYVDRKMWDDVADLFAADALIEIGGIGIYGGANIRTALERMGPAGLAYGELNDRPIFDTVVRLSKGGNEAYARGIEVGMLGRATSGEASWEFSVFRNRFVKEGGIWKIREMRIQPLMKADYASGWGSGGIGGAVKPPVPAFLAAKPALDGATWFAAKPLTGKIARGPAPAADLADLRRRWMRSTAFDAAENLSAAYGYFLDDFQWPKMSALFAVKGNKQSPFAGYYIGRDRIDAAANAMWGPAPQMRAAISYHWRIQPVIHVSHDGRSANLRARLLQPRTSKDPATNGFAAGMYPNDQLVLEDGVWRFWSLTIDEHYFTSPDWKGGWSAAKEPPPGEAARPSPLMTRYPPDVAITALGRREEGFRGGTGTTITWPGILPMWFHYRNPVSGRTPELYWPDCVPCELLPQARMTANGYQMPPSGPQVDGVEVE